MALPALRVMVMCLTQFGLLHSRHLRTERRLKVGTTALLLQDIELSVVITSAAITTGDGLIYSY